jgi:DNA-binding transcriptional ArsR family regulator
VHAFDILGDPVRRRILEVLAEHDGDGAAPGVSAGEIVSVIQAEFGITQPAVSRQLRVLRESGFVRVTVDGRRRLYRTDPAGMSAVEQWLRRYSRLWSQRLDALDTELRRGRRSSSEEQGR